MGSDHHLVSSASWPVVIFRHNVHPDSSNGLPQNSLNAGELSGIYRHFSIKPLISVIGQGLTLLWTVQISRERGSFFSVQRERLYSTQRWHTFIPSLIFLGILAGVQCTIIIDIDHHPEQLLCPWQPSLSTPHSSGASAPFLASWVCDIGWEELLVRRSLNMLLWAVKAIIPNNSQKLSSD